MEQQLATALGAGSGVVGRPAGVAIYRRSRNSVHSGTMEDIDDVAFLTGPCSLTHSLSFLLCSSPVLPCLPVHLKSMINSSPKS